MSERDEGRTGGTLVAVASGFARYGNNDEVRGSASKENGVKSSWSIRFEDNPVDASPSLCVIKLNLRSSLDSSQLYHTLP